MSALGRRMGPAVGAAGTGCRPPGVPPSRRAPVRVSAAAAAAALALCLPACPGPLAAKPESPALACDRLEAAAETDPQARRELGVCFLLGRGRLTDHARALALFTSAAAAGDEQARFALAAALLFKVRDEARYPEAVQSLTALVASGHAPAHFPLAVAHVAGLGVAEDLPLAVSHFAAAAEHGDDVAAFLLAVSHRFGLLGLTPDAAESRRWLGRWLAIVQERFPGLEIDAARLREAALGLHHDRLLREFVFSDEQLELFPGLAREVAAGGGLPGLAPAEAGAVP